MKKTEQKTKSQTKKLVVAGGGVLGSQIAFQSAYAGFDVTIWGRSEGSIARTKTKVADLKKKYASAIEHMAKGKDIWCLGIADVDKFDEKKCLKKVEKAAENIKYETDLAKAVKDADLFIECVAEVKKEKIAFYKRLSMLLPEKTLLATNSSTLLPSTFAKHTGRPDKFLSMHFANSIWKNNITEIMSQAKTSDESFDLAMKYAEKMRMLPLPVNKEKSGYLLNSMLVPFLLSGLDLFVNGVSDPKSVDKAWRRGTGSPRGPFEIMDVVGLQTVYNIVEQYQRVPRSINPLLKKMMMPYNYRGMLKTLKKYISEGKMGKQSGEGFYKY